MRIATTSFILVLTVLNAAAQSQFLVIGRNTGMYPALDGNSIRIFGFTQTLSSPVYIPAPTLTFIEGDSVEVDFWNVSQGAPHTIHLHGLDLDQQNDGVPHLSFEVGHMEHGYYRFRAPHAGTYLYHCHVTSPIHVQAGMYGLVVIRPPGGGNTTWAGGYEYDSDHAWLTSEMDTFWHQEAVLNHDHDSTNPGMQVLLPDYHPQYFLVNGLSENQLTDPNERLTAAVNERVYLRLANVGFMANRYEFPPGLNALIVSSDGRPLPATESSDTLWVFPGERFGVMLTPQQEFVSTVAVGFVDLNTLNQKSVQHIPVTVSGYFGVNDPARTDLFVFPNPTADLLSVRLGEEAFHTILVYDMFGRCVHETTIPAGADEVRIDLHDVPPGTYTLEAWGSSNRTAHRIVIIR